MPGKRHGLRFVADAARAWLQGEGSIREVAQRFGVSASTISRFARRAGVPRRKAARTCTACGSPQHDRRNCPDRHDAEPRSTGGREEVARA